MRVEGAVNIGSVSGALDDVRADYVARAAVTVDVVDAGLGIIFLDEDRRRRPNRDRVYAVETDASMTRTLRFRHLQLDLIGWIRLG